MQPKGSAQIISVNKENVRICASAARISTTLGDAMQIYLNATDYSSNSTLIDKVMRSGHSSLIEHAVFTIAFSNVSVLVEQFIIEFRLASYTVKSRRYVDYSNMGYYTPGDISESTRLRYRDHMDFLFDEYKYLISNNVPKEDARFILPYSFLSNFYCTVNARELQHILKEIFGGRGANNIELVSLGNQLYEQLGHLFPYILRDIEAVRDSANEHIAEPVTFPCISAKPIISKSMVELISYSDSTTCKEFKAFFETGQGKELGKASQRVLEFINATFIIRDVSLSGLTHIVRHRMQSIIVPPIWSIDPSRFLIPDSISVNKSLCERYLNAFARNAEFIGKLREHNFNYEVYLALSGNTIDFINSMNARELNLFFRLRCCTRAQWEIRNIANDMLRILRDKNGEQFAKFGPSCFADGNCPEGRLSCGRYKTALSLKL